MCFIVRSTVFGPVHRAVFAVKLVELNTSKQKLPKSSERTGLGLAGDDCEEVHLRSHLGKRLLELNAAVHSDARPGHVEQRTSTPKRRGRRAVQAALASAWPAQRAPYPPRASKLDPFKGVIDQIPIAGLGALRKHATTL